MVHAGSLGILFAVGLLSLFPALSHGGSLGPFDQLSAAGLSARPAVVVHDILSSDQIRQMIPWTALDWRDVHAGHLPLWNPYSVLGMPLAFNWQSAPFSIPLLVGYLFPLRLAYGIGVIVKLLIAGSGAYVFARVLRLHTLGAILAGVVFELSGPFSVWAGYTLTGVVVWAGWIFAAATLVIAGRHRLRDSVLLAVVVSFSIYGGDPEVTFLVLLAVGIYVLCLLVRRAAGSGGPIARPVRDLVVSVVVGGALAAPLLLPGIQVASRGARVSSAGYQALPIAGMVNLAFARFYGFTVAGTNYFGVANYYATAAYVGVIALALSVVGIACYRRRHEVMALTVVGVVLLALIYVPKVASIPDRLPVVDAVLWMRALPVVALVPAVLAGYGVTALLSGQTARRAVLWTAAAFGAAGLAVGALWVYFSATRSAMPTLTQGERAASFVWPVLGVAAGLVVAGVLWLHRDRHHGTR